eukprot:GAHX01003276.1.p1 GENE.GAHX01003276.1~~GAHX01003276.1.p1  ORF type:complete len:403 (+),score=53.92 GAHX01003276.1:109-1317(+)
MMNHKWMFSGILQFLNRRFNSNNIEKMTIFTPSKNLRSIIKSGIPHFTEHVLYNFLKSRLDLRGLLKLPYTTRRGTFYNFSGIKTSEDLSEIQNELFNSPLKHLASISNLVKAERENILYEKHLVNKNPINKLFDLMHNKAFSAIKDHNPNKYQMYYRYPIEGTYKDILGTDCSDIIKYYEDNYNQSNQTNIVYSKGILKDRYKHMLTRPYQDNKSPVYDNRLELKEGVFIINDKDNTIHYKIKQINGLQINSVNNNFIDIVINDLLTRKFPFLIELFNMNYNEVLLEGIAYSNNQEISQETRTNIDMQNIKEKFREMILQLSKQDVKLCKKNVLKSFKFNKLVENEPLFMKFNDLLIDYNPETTNNIFINKRKLKNIEMIINSLTFEDVFDRLCVLNTFFK